MVIKQALESLEEQPQLEPVVGVLEKIASAGLSGGGPVRQRIKNALHGVWLGHPLHPMLTDVPVGAWTAGFVLDTLEMATGREEFGKGADVAVGLGLAAAVPTALSGIADWQHTSGKPRNAGVVHALFNSVATLLYGASLLSRMIGARSAGRIFGMLGYGAMSVGSYVGGEIVFQHKIGVDHAPETNGIDEFVPAYADEKLIEGKPVRVTVKRIPIMLVRLDNRIYALANRCSHLSGPLSDGSIEDCSVVCPWHGSRFSLVDGQVIDGPATFPQPAFETRVRDGQIEVRAIA